MELSPSGFGSRRSKAGLGWAGVQNSLQVVLLRRHGLCLGFSKGVSGLCSFILALPLGPFKTYGLKVSLLIQSCILMQIFNHL